MGLHVDQVSVDTLISWYKKFITRFRSKALADNKSKLLVMYKPSFSHMYHFLYIVRVMWQNLNSYWAIVCRFTFLMWYCMRQIILNLTYYPFSTFLLHGNIALYPRLWNSGYSLFQILNLFILQLLFQLLAKFQAAVKYLSLHAIIFSTSLETDMRNRGRKMKWINLYVCIKNPD